MRVSKPTIWEQIADRAKRHYGPKRDRSHDYAAPHHGRHSGQMRGTVNYKAFVEVADKYTEMWTKADAAYAQATKETRLDAWRHIKEFEVKKVQQLRKECKKRGLKRANKRLGYTTQIQIMERRLTEWANEQQTRI